MLSADYSQIKLRMVMQVHDELVFEVPALMAGAASQKVPLEVEVGLGPNWGKRTECTDDIGHRGPRARARPSLPLTLRLDIVRFVRLGMHAAHPGIRCRSTSGSPN